MTANGAHPGTPPEDTPLRPSTTHAGAARPVNAEESAACAESSADRSTEPVIEPLKVEPPQPTGDEHVDGALATLGRVSDLPTEEHGAVYEDVHRGLRDTLAALDR